MKTYFASQLPYHEFVEWRCKARLMNDQNIVYGYCIREFSLDIENLCKLRYCVEDSKVLHHFFCIAKNREF